MDEKILALIRNKEYEYVSGEEISKVLSISRAAIWKHIDKLRHEGYDIAAMPHLGYKLISAPDRLIEPEVSWNLKTKVLGKKIYSYKKTDSTNTIAYKLAENGAPEGTVVFAETQAKGRGRFHRAWESPEGGIYMSIILRPALEPMNTARITLAAAVAVAEAIREATNMPANIKWPNDILINGLKACGILTEMMAEQDSIVFIIVGIGINVNSDAKSLPKGSTSLKEESGSAVSRVTLAKTVLEMFEKNYLNSKKGFDTIIEEWRNLSATLGKRVKLHTQGDIIEGQALDIDQNGGLILRLDSGFNKHILSGDVELVR